MLLYIFSFCDILNFVFIFSFLHYFTYLTVLKGVYSIVSANNFLNVGKTTVEGKQLC